MDDRRAPRTRTTTPMDLGPITTLKLVLARARFRLARAVLALHPGKNPSARQAPAPKAARRTAWAGRDAIRARPRRVD